ncbi:ppsC [Symbiodinium necroappetens]|uniref:PpsC protein n=1 Tax=Symbiodinium necroappetens TaxID=1628268 RepID=A0A812MWH1_9DINO|nr:ppsC [Symbiodinium necroappetens]
MTSPLSRCFTFDSTANGYSEGTSGMILKYGNHEQASTIFRASQVGQDGRSASLTAPNGPGQEEIISRAIREAKTNIGHLEGGAAMAAMVKSVLTVQQGQCLASFHVRQLNPHLEHTIFDAFFETEHSSPAAESGVDSGSSLGLPDWVFDSCPQRRDDFSPSPRSIRDSSVASSASSPALSCFETPAPPSMRPRSPQPKAQEEEEALHMPAAGGQPARARVSWADLEEDDVEVSWQWR